MDDAQAIFDQLSMPFPSTDIEWRVGSTTKDKSKGMCLAYINARVVMDRLDSACGPANWQKRYPVVGDKTICEIGVRINGEWIWKSDGAGDTDFEGTKGGLSDAFKRAAVCWGVGRYLYDMDAPWVALENEGRKIPDAELKKLAEVHEKAATMLGWGDPADRQVFRLLSAVVKDTVTQPSDAEAFRKKYSGEIALLRVKARNYLNTQLDRIGGTLAEAAE